FFQAEDGIRDLTVTGVQTCALPIWDVLMLRLFRNLFKKTSRPAERSRQFRPTVERLEAREVMSVSASEQLFIYLLNRARHDPQEIGRASCRERGWRSVGSGSIENTM